MKDTAKTMLMIYLSKLEDPRTGKNTRHKFIEIIFIAICAVISGCECWTEIEDYGKAKEHWLKGFLSLEGGILSHETLRRPFCILDFEKFQGVLIKWAQEVKKSLGLEEDQRG